ncbi:MAG: class I SAM-dependent methyltransferase [Gammaproteobacteria bacterium]|nr:class I SAM-dependent methyltransferase [Gammaproteobacteria bacterium]
MNDRIEHPDMPKQWVDGLVPTMNDKGFMFEVIDDYAEAFIRFAGDSPDEAVEIGCAYGVATLAALRAGAKITACDMEPRHLEVLASRAPEALRENLTTHAGTLPDIDLPEAHFGSLLCSRVLHFLPGDEIDQSVRNMYRWLKPGGRLFLVADTPFGIWRKFIPTWDENKANDERWPGMMVPPVKYLPYEPSDEDVGPPVMNLLDPDLLQRTAEEAGFVVERCSYINRDDFKGLGSMDGRENCGLEAVKPA